MSVPPTTPGRSTHAAQHQWSETGVERERSGWCFSHMEVVGEARAADGKLVYEFRRHASHPLLQQIDEGSVRYAQPMV